MKAKQQLNITQSQSLNMTPQLIQAIKLLQYANVELTEYVRNIAQDNPFIEIDEQNFAKEKENKPEKTEQFLDVEVGDIYPDLSKVDLQNIKSTHEKNSFSANRNSNQRNNENFADNWEKSLTKAKTMREALLEQLFILTKNTIKRKIGIELIENTDDSGYTKADVEVIAKKLKVKKEIIEELWLAMQEFEPAGIMAKNLAECLKIQLQEKNQYDKYIQVMLKNLNEIAYSSSEKICKICNIKEEQLKNYMQQIKALNPKPGENFITNKAETLVHDIILKKDNDNGWKIKINTDTIPKVLIDKQYYQYVNTKITKNEKNFVSQNYNNANWLVKSIRQRNETMLKVATEIVKKQDLFLAYGIEYIKPMTLKNVADNIKMHESTISRAISNKYIQTPSGIFPLKFFFCSAVRKNSQDNVVHANTKIKHIIKNIIKNETKIFSDKSIVEILKEQYNIELARRTVTKYRKAMNIYSSAHRKKLKNRL